MTIYPTLSFRFETEELDTELTAIINRVGDRSTVHRIIGQTLFNRHRDRFLKQVSLDGTPWAPLSSLTLSLRRSRVGILRDSGELFRSLHFKSDASKAEIGTNLNHPKVMVHQHGAVIKPKAGRSLMIPRAKSANRPFFIKQANIPARPFVGIDVGDKELVIDVLQEFITSIQR